VWGRGVGGVWVGGGGGGGGVPSTSATAKLALLRQTLWFGVIFCVRGNAKGRGRSWAEWGRKSFSYHRLLRRIGPKSL